MQLFMLKDTNLLLISTFSIILITFIDNNSRITKLFCKAIKIASGELTNLPFLTSIAFKKLPVILSTGMGTLGEVEEAVKENDDIKKFIDGKEIVKEIYIPGRMYTIVIK